MNRVQQFVCWLFRIPEYEKIAKLDLKPGQTLVVSIQHYTEANARRIIALCHKDRLVPEGVAVIVKANSTHLSVLNPQP